MDRRIDEVLTLISRDLGHPWRASALAKEVRLSVSRFYDLFRSTTGTVPARYIRARRLEKARHLLLTTHLTVKEIAGYVGIGDPSHFVRHFEKVYGISPRRFRRAHETSLAPCASIAGKSANES